MLNNEKKGSTKMEHQVNTLASTKIRGFLNKKRLNVCGFAQEFLRSGMLYRPGKSLKRRSTSSSLHSKKKFLLGVCEFCVSDIIRGGLLNHLGPLCIALLFLFFLHKTAVFFAKIARTIHTPRC